MNVVVANAPSGVGSIASKIHLEQRLKEAMNQKEITEVRVRVGVFLVPVVIGVFPPKI